MTAVTSGTTVRMSDIVKPTPKQREAWAAVDSHRYTLYGGARGGGKSYWLRWTLVRLLVKWGREGHKGVRVGLFSEDFPTLEDRQLSKIRTEFPDWLGTWHEQRREFRLAPEWGGGVLCFRNLDEPSKYQSAEFAAVAVEELTKNTLDVFNTLRGSLRWPGINDTKFIGATNPGGIGHGWVKSYWILRQYPKELERLAPQFAFVQSLPADNPHLTESYWEELRSLPPMLAKAWVEGSWDVFEGQAFPEWDSTVHVKDVAIPSNWRWFAGMDWGWVRGCFVLCASGPDGLVHTRLEFPFSQMTPEEVGIGLARLLRESKVGWPEWTMCDHDMFAYKGEPTIIERVQTAMQRVGGPDASLRPRQADKGPGSRLAGKLLVHQMLRFKPEHKRPDGSLEPWHQPRLTVHPECRYLTRTIPELPVDEDNPEDVDTDADDHGYDALRYALMGRAPEVYAKSAEPKEGQHPGYDAEGRPMRRRGVAGWFADKDAMEQAQRAGRFTTGLGLTGFHVSRGDE